MRKILTNFPLSRVLGQIPNTQVLPWGDPTQILKADLVLLNNAHRTLLMLAALKWIFPFLKYRLISVDILLRAPGSNLKSVARTKFKRFLFRKVDLFILYFRDTSGYEREYGLEKNQLRYVPFKVNSWETLKNKSAGVGQYVLCAGRTMRDVKTYLRAMEICGLPGVLLLQNEQEMLTHGTEISNLNIPCNVRVETHSDGKDETYFRWIEEARLVVIPRFRRDIGCTGISTYLCAMALKRTVLISSGPGAEDVLTNGEALFFPPENPEALAQILVQAWTENKNIAESGFLYAQSLGGEERLLRDLLEASR